MQHTQTADRQSRLEIAESLQCINTHQNTTLTACQLADLVSVCVRFKPKDLFCDESYFFPCLSQPKLMAKDLLDLVASHFNLKEKEYFGISYVDETYVYPRHPIFCLF